MLNEGSGTMAVYSVILYNGDITFSIHWNIFVKEIQTTRPIAPSVWFVPF